MREILFKAKGQTDDKWHIGFLANLYGGICIIRENEHEWICKPETISQCTGLKDKNGNLIWENDVVKQFADCNELGNSLYFFYQIRWNNEYSAFEGYEIYTKETVLFPDLEDIEVIGNIFDNPELMNE